jgi:hypothetical protein
MCDPLGSFHWINFRLNVLFSANVMLPGLLLTELSVIHSY